MGLMDDLVRAGSQALGAKFNQGPSLGGGAFARAELVSLVPPCRTFRFNFNPDNIKMTKQVRLDETPEQGQDQGRLQFKQGSAWRIELPDLIFDTYEQKADVRDVYIKPLETFIYVEAEEHAVPRLRFHWGKFRPDFDLVLTGLDVTYEMFLSDGTPVRAKAKLTLKSYTTETPRQGDGLDNRNNSPDHARIYTVRRGDTLPLIAQHAYDTPAEWRRIASYNDLDDPLRIEPGTRLLLPPILK